MNTKQNNAVLCVRAESEENNNKKLHEGCELPFYVSLSSHMKGTKTEERCEERAKQQKKTKITQWRAKRE